jgi:hypothetical protein
MITPSFGLTATERVLPRATFDFMTSSLDSRITFTRTGATATRVNSSGNIETVAADTPRFDFNPISLACKGLLIEELRVNQFTYSNDFRDTTAAGGTRPWTYVNVSVSADAASSPDGTQNADKIEETSATAEHAIFHNNYVASSVTLTVSVFAKAAERSKINLVISDFATGGASCVYDLSAGTAGTASSNTGEYTSPVGSITPYKDGWYRCVLTAVKGSGNTNNYVVINLNNGSTTNYAGTTGSGAFWYGAQLELGAHPTSYIPTVAATVTRNPDIGVISGTNFTSWWNDTEGAAEIEVLPGTISGVRPILRFDDNTNNETIVFRSNIADPQFSVTDGGAVQTTLDAGTISANTVHKFTGAWKSASFSTAINGGAAVSQLSGTYPTVTHARLGASLTGYLNGHLQKIMYWPQRLIDAEVQAFSK